MTSKIIEQPKEVKPEYPCLKINKTNKRVVLFTEKNTGFQVACETYENDNIGFFSNTWAEDMYSSFTGKLELSN